MTASNQVQGLAQRVRPNGLDQVCREPRGQRALAVAVLTPARDSDHRWAVLSQGLGQHSSDVVALQVGQPDVDEDEVELVDVVSDQSDTRPAVDGHAYAVAPMLEQQLRHCPDVVLVLDDRDAQGASARARWRRLFFGCEVTRGCVLARGSER